MTVTERSDIPHTYVVQSGPNTYNVDLRQEFDPRCDCPQMCWTDTVCKHCKAAMAFRDGDL